MSPLEIPLEVRKEMEIAWRQVRAAGRMGENLKLQRQLPASHLHKSVRNATAREDSNDENNNDNDNSGETVTTFVVT